MTRRTRSPSQLAGNFCFSIDLSSMPPCSQVRTPVSTAPRQALRGRGERGEWSMMSAMTRNSHTPVTLELSGDGLTLDDAERVLRGQVDRLTLAPAARK